MQLTTPSTNQESSIQQKDILPQLRISKDKKLGSLKLSSIVIVTIIWPLEAEKSSNLQQKRNWIMILNSNLSQVRASNKFLTDIKPGHKLQFSFQTVLSSSKKILSNELQKNLLNLFFFAVAIFQSSKPESRYYPSIFCIFLIISLENPKWPQNNVPLCKKDLIFIGLVFLSLIFICN